MRVCVLSLEFPPFFTIGGIGTYVRTTCEDLADLGVVVDVCCAGDTQGAFQIRENLTVHTFTYRNYTRDIGEALLLSSSIALRKKADVTFAHFPYIFLHQLVAPTFKRPFVLGVHTTFKEEHEGALPSAGGGARYAAYKLQLRLYSHLEGNVFRRQRAIVTVSNKEKEILEQIGAPREILHVVPCGIDLNGLIPEPPTEIGEGEEGKKTILYVGRLVSRKGVQDLVKAASILKTSKTEFKICIVGEGALREYLDRMSAEMRLQDVLRFTGYVSEGQRKALLRNCYMFILPSYQDALGIAAIEAMAFSKPVIVTSSSGIAGYIEKYRTESIVEPGKPFLLAQAMDNLLADEKLARNIGQYNKTIVETWFDRKRNAEVLRNILAECLISE